MVMSMGPAEWRTGPDQAVLVPWQIMAGVYETHDLEPALGSGVIDPRNPPSAVALLAGRSYPAHEPRSVRLRPARQIEGHLAPPAPRMDQPSWGAILDAETPGYPLEHRRPFIHTKRGWEDYRGSIFPWSALVNPKPITTTAPGGTE